MLLVLVGVFKSCTIIIHLNRQCCIKRKQDMITVIIFGILFAGFIALLSYNNPYGNPIGDGIGGLIVGVSVGFIVAAIIPAKTHEIHYTYEVVSLQDNMSVSGSFFLGTGYINGNMKYVFYKKDGNFYEMVQLKHDKVKIQYTSKEPIVNVYEERYNGTPYWGLKFGGTGNKRYVIEVPKGTILNNYTLDAK